MSELDEDITAYYDRGDEARRLDDLAGLERVRTQVLLERYLPPAPAAVLDVGGGPGAYAIWLAGLGYDVTLIDPVALHVEQAREAGVRAELGDARALDAANESTDAVLMLGPLYHLPDADDRRGALEEAHRVLRPGGVVAVAAITRFASTIDGLLKGYAVDPVFERTIERVLDSGAHTNPTRHPRWFTTAYFHLPDELGAEVSAAGFDSVALLAIEGVGGWLPDADEWLGDPPRREPLLRAIARVEAEPSLLGASPHVLAIGFKR